MILNFQLDDKTLNLFLKLKVCFVMHFERINYAFVHWLDNTSEIWGKKSDGQVINN
jgi:hypothetical protein